MRGLKKIEFCNKPKKLGTRSKNQTNGSQKTPEILIKMLKFSASDLLMKPLKNFSKFKKIKPWIAKKNWIVSLEK